MSVNASFNINKFKDNLVPDRSVVEEDAFSHSVYSFFSGNNLKQEILALWATACAFGLQ